MKRVLFFLSVAFLCLCSSISCSNSSNTYEDVFDAGVKYFNKEDYEKSAECFSAILESIPDDADALIYRGLCYGNIYLEDGSENFYSGSVSDLNKALSICENEVANYFLGYIKYCHEDKDFEKYLKKGGEEGIGLLKSIKVNSSRDDKAVFQGAISFGSGFLIDSKGYLVTNYHVINDAVKNKGLKIFCWTKKSGVWKKYRAEHVTFDETDDIAIIKITDENYRPVHIPYKIEAEEVPVGTSVFTMGYPLPDDLGTEVKATKGIINSLSGFKGDIREYQIDANIDHGNSGGPLFSEDGRLIGINSSGYAENNNVNYAIKICILEEIAEEIGDKLSIPKEGELGSMSLSEKIAAISPCVYLITISE